MVLAVPYDPHWINNKFTFNLLQNQNWVAREDGYGCLATYDFMEIELQDDLYAYRIN